MTTVIKLLLIMHHSNVAVPNVAKYDNDDRKISMQLTTQANPFPFLPIRQGRSNLDVSYAF